MCMCHVRHGSYRDTHESSLDALKKCHVRGEITREKYEKMKRVLLEEDDSKHG